MSYFPSEVKLMGLGFTPREEHHSDFTNWTKPFSGNKYHRITKRKVVIDITEEICFQEITGHDSLGARRNKISFHGYFPSEAFFDELLIAVGWMPSKSRYIPSSDKLASVGFYPSHLSTSRTSCWYRKMDDFGWGHHLTLDNHLALHNAGKAMLEQMRYGQINYQRFSGIFSSEEFFDVLLSSYKEV